MPPTKWEIVAQWFGQNGSHALRAEHCQRGERAQSAEFCGVEFRSAECQTWVQRDGIQIRVQWRKAEMSSVQSWEGIGCNGAAAALTQSLEIKMPAAVCGLPCLQQLHRASFSKFSSGEVAGCHCQITPSGRINALNMTWDKSLTTSQLITSHGLHEITSMELKTRPKDLSNTSLQFCFGIRADKNKWYHLALMSLNLSDMESMSCWYRLWEPAKRSIRNLSGNRAPLPLPQLTTQQSNTALRNGVFRKSIVLPCVAGKRAATE